MVPNILGSRPWPFKMMSSIKWPLDSSYVCMPFPVGVPLEPSFYFQQVSRYSASNPVCMHTHTHTSTPHIIFILSNATALDRQLWPFRGPGDHGVWKVAILLQRHILSWILGCSSPVLFATHHSFGRGVSRDFLTSILSPEARRSHPNRPSPTMAHTTWIHWFGSSSCPSTAGRPVAHSLSQPPLSGTLCQTTCKLHRLSLASGDSWRHSCFTRLFRT